MLAFGKLGSADIYIVDIAKSEHCRKHVRISFLQFRPDPPDEPGKA
jgi:hypothetical protein